MKTLSFKPFTEQMQAELHESYEKGYRRGYEEGIAEAKSETLLVVEENDREACIDAIHAQIFTLTKELEHLKGQK
jgi:flagellar biosynthesis/type III secretory pathway protein FliH